MPQTPDSVAPRLTIRVAVTGHRPPKLSPALEPGIRTAVRQILEEVLVIARGIAACPVSGYTDREPALYLISSLAEGADRIVAEEGLALSAFLQCPLPASREEYRKDFPESATEFDRLLCKATAVFELDGSRPENSQWLQPSDYARAGKMATAHCDVLIAVWDGAPGDRGGTGNVARGAMRAGIPTVRVDLNTPPEIALCAGHDEWQTDWKRALGEALRNAFAAPPTCVAWLARYGKEKVPFISERDRADLLSVRYRDRYRHSYYLKYWLSAFAVLFAAAGLIPGLLPRGAEFWWPALELICIAGILASFYFAWHYHWHERWLDYRMLVEEFRILEFLAPLGETVPQFRPPAYWQEPGPRACVGWYFRAKLREMGLPDTRVTPDFVERQRQNVLSVAQGQIEYNGGKHKSTESSHKRYHRWGIALFAATAAACSAHLAYRSSINPALLGALTATLPAFAAALEGLQAQAEWKRLSSRAERMQGHIESLARRLRNEDGSLASVSSVATDLADAMTSETSEWHNLIHGKPLELG